MVWGQKGWRNTSYIPPQSVMPVTDVGENKWSDEERAFPVKAFYKKDDNVRDRAKVISAGLSDRIAWSCLFGSRDYNMGA